MKKGEWRRNRLGRMVKIKPPSGGQLVEHLVKKSPGRPPKAIPLSNGAVPPEQDALQAILDRSFQKLSVAEKIAALDPRKS